MNGIRSGLRLGPDELDQVVRLARFKAAHPDVVVGDDLGRVGRSLAGMSGVVIRTTRHSRRCPPYRGSLLAGNGQPRQTFQGNACSRRAAGSACGLIPGRGRAREPRECSPVPAVTSLAGRNRRNVTTRRSGPSQCHIATVRGEPGRGTSRAAAAVNQPVTPHQQATRLSRFPLAASRKPPAANPEDPGSCIAGRTSSQWRRVHLRPVRSCHRTAVARVQDGGQGAEGGGGELGEPGGLEVGLVPHDLQVEGAEQAGPSGPAWTHPQ